MKRSMTMLALALGALFVALHVPSSMAICDYWGVGTGCNYDGRHERPENCKGLGRRYCDRAPETKTCPEACRALVRTRYCRVCVFCSGQ